MKTLTKISALAVVLMAMPGCSKEKYYEKVVEFPEGATIEEKVEMAAHLVPTAKQIAWQDLELTAFLHFGINTFTGREWGNGQESPEIFTPDALDTDQWVKTLKEAGFRMVMLTAKHHDGFCLWPTATTEHSVASSPWLEGKGDVVAMLAESCRKYDMKLGLYLSPWDRNAECYGDSPRYNDMFVEQLTELLTNYGKVDEVWFDGACGEGPNGKRQEYDWDRYKKTIEELQPGAVVAIMGEDVRWVGNEKGLGRETEWSATALVPETLPHAAAENERMGLFKKAPDLGSRELIEKANALYWWPSEVDVSIRPGWFYHDSEQPRSLRELANIYINSVGRNSVLLLNIPPDKHGLIAEADVERLAELRAWIDETFSNNLIAKPVKVRDMQAEIAFAEPTEVNAIELEENIKKGQRVEAFAFEALVDGEWIPMAAGTTVGHKRILVADRPVKAEAVRVTVTECRLTPNLRVKGVYNIKMPAVAEVTLPQGFEYAEVVATEPDIRVAEGEIWISDDAVEAITLDMGETAEMAGFAYTPRQDDLREGIIFKYTVEASRDGAKWETIKTPEEFSNIDNNPITQFVYFKDMPQARYLRLTPVSTVDGGKRVSVSELKIIKKS